MELMNLLLKRRSVRNYTGDPVPRENWRQFWRPAFFGFRAEQEALGACCHVGPGYTGKAFSLPYRRGADAGEGRLCDSGICGSGKNARLTEDCSMVMSNMHLMAASLGLGSCWIQGRLRFAENGESTEGFCRRLLGVPEEYALEAILSVGIRRRFRNHTNRRN